MSDNNISATSSENDQEFKIESLTSEQEAMLPIIAEQGIKYGKSTEPLNKEVCIAAAKLSYEKAGLTPPPDDKYDFAPSPMAGLILANKICGNTSDTNQWIEPFYGQHEAAWLSFYITFKMLGLKCVEKLDGLIELMKNAGWTWFLDGHCIISERPIHLDTDDQGRLHSDIRKALLSWFLEAM